MISIINYLAWLFIMVIYLNKITLDLIILIQPFWTINMSYFYSRVAVNIQ